jgi:iron complex transport system ATP-binding protein
MVELLSASNIWFAYEQEPVLRVANLRLSSGEVVGLLGPNGSGKSTLMRALLGMLQTQGQIQWLGRPLSKWTRKQLARRVAYLPQTPTYLTGQTVVDVLRVGRAPYWSAFGVESPRDEQIVREASKLLSLDDLLSRDMDELSAGQRQRVFIGRCLAQQPLAMLLDEPNTFLDLKHQVELSQLLRQLSRKRDIGVLMASHDLNLAATFSDRLLLLSAGEITAQGDADDVLREDLLSAAYGVPIERFNIGVNRPPFVVPKSGR